MNGLLYAVELVTGVGLVIFLHELGHFAVAKWRGIRVEKFSLGFGPRIVGVTHQGTEYRISWIPLGGYVKMAGENPEEARQGDPSEFLSQPWWSRFLVVIAGPFMNMVLGVALFAGVLMIGAQEPVVGAPQIGQVMSADSPAALAGLRDGDLVTAVNRAPVSTWMEMTDLVRAHPSVPLTLTVSREGALLTLVATPRGVSDGERLIGQLGIQGKISHYVQRRLGPVEAFRAAGKITWGIGRDFVRTIKRLIFGEMSMKDSLRGPVGIVQIAVGEMKVGFLSFLWFLAIISINLAVVNLLPIPVLDGGHVMMLAVEAVRRKPLSLKAQLIVQQAGLILLLTLVLYTTVHDLLRLK